MPVRVVIAALAVSLLAVAQANAQIIPEPPSRIPAPLPPPPQAPIINGPLQQAPPPGVYQPPRLNTHSDRTIGCLHQGTAAGLKGQRLQTYARECANGN